MDAEAVATAIRHDPEFRARALADPDALVSEHHLDSSSLLTVSELLQQHPPTAPGWGAEHATLFALIAAARRNHTVSQPASDPQQP